MGKTNTVNDEIKAATDELAAATETAEVPAEETIVKSLVGTIERLTKAGFGSWEAAHNGQPLDESAPMGKASGAEMQPSTEAQENPAGAAAKISNSTNRSRNRGDTAPVPTTLNKGKADEDIEVVKSRDTLTQDKFYRALEEDGSEDFIPVAEASDAITFLAETMAKAFEHLSAQIAATSVENEARYDEIQKSMSLQGDAILTLVKSAKATADIAKSHSATKPAPTAQPATGVVIVNTGGDTKSETTNPASRSALVKSISAAINDGRLDSEKGASFMQRIDTQGAQKVWETMPEDIRKVVLNGDLSK
jgi:hypothetical protein